MALKLSNSQINKLKSKIKDSTLITLNISSNAFGESKNETNFPHKLLLTNTQVSMTCNAFTNGPSANIKFSKTRLSRMIQLGEFLDRFLGPLCKTRNLKRKCT